MNEQPLDLKAFFRAIWRRRVLIGALALVGFIAGIAQVVLMPVAPKARVLVILPPSSLVTTSDGTQVDQMPTQIIIATSTPVLAAAGAAVSPPVSPTALKSRVAVTALSTDVLQFQVTAAKARDAEKLANAEATAYIAYVNKTGSASTNGVVPALQQEATQLSHQIQGLQDQINKATAQLAADGASTPAGQRDASLISSLRTEEEEVSLQLNNINNEIVSTQLSGSLSAGATRVLQSAAIVPVSKANLAEYPLVGALSGIFAGCLFAFFASRRDRKLWLRDELASALGVPVLASLECAACKSARDWRRLLEKYQPSPLDSWNFRRLLHGLPLADADKGVQQNDKGPQVNVVAFADDGPSLAAGVQLARSAAEFGIQAALLPGEHQSLALLRAACTLVGAGSPDQPFRFEPRATGQELSAILLTLSIVAVDEAKPTLPIKGGASVLAVSSGFATPEGLARVALAASDAGHPIDGILVVNPDPADGTVGAVPMGGEARQLSRHAGHRSGAERSSGQPRWAN
jgi:capsular polysaccharide biosynthesis protein